MILLSEIKSTNFGKNVTNVIYKITNLINGKIYVGKTNGKLRKEFYHIYLMLIHILNQGNIIFNLPYKNMD